MKKIRLKTKFDFDSAHRLVGYAGKCQKIHGHLWKVNLTVIGDKNQLDSIGILWDFTNVKQLKTLLDHKIILKRCPENNKIGIAIEETCGKDAIYWMDENPTAEYLVNEILEHCKTSNPDLDYIVEVYESPKSCAIGSTIVEREQNEKPK